MNDDKPIKKVVSYMDCQRRNIIPAAMTFEEYNIMLENLYKRGTLARWMDNAVEKIKKKSSPD